jgi:hypothetical protein
MIAMPEINNRRYSDFAAHLLKITAAEINSAIPAIKDKNISAKFSFI